MILIFDLDDTLYDERTYVDSGLMAVAKYGLAYFGWEVESSYRFMQYVLEKKGRGHIFDLWLETHGRMSKKLVAECVRVYRHHTPDIKLSGSAAELLPSVALEYPLYLVTDGHKIAQRKKVEALEIMPLFRRVLITHRFGLRHSKPSTYCFNLIRNAEKCGWNDLVYVGDNPAKDFVNIKRNGVHTIRLLAGQHSNDVARCGYEADFSIRDLSLIPELLQKLQV
ncbi:MAG: HAD family hydrolase [Halioglobus sp.]